VVALLLVVLFRGNGKRRPQAAANAPRAPLAPTHGGGTHAHPPTPATVHQATLQGPAGVFSVSGGTEVRAGRDGEQCVVLLTDASVSGVHASLKIEGGQFWVRDERSNNGTFIDDNRLAAGAWTRIESGARLRFGPVSFNVRLE
jgi:pSer/pThr/pTyr-binding forkhead associated (FHA) protein